MRIKIRVLLDLWSGLVLPLGFLFVEFIVLIAAHLWV